MTDDIASKYRKDLADEAGVQRLGQPTWRPMKDVAANARDLQCWRMWQVHAWQAWLGCQQARISTMVNACAARVRQA